MFASVPCRHLVKVLVVTKFVVSVAVNVAVAIVIHPT